MKLQKPLTEFTSQDKIEWCVRCADKDSPEGAITFITNFCFTVDEHTKIAPIPDWPYVTEFVEALWSGWDLHVEKTRQMIGTWIVCAFALWELQFKNGYLGFMTSRKERLVDDGGENSSPNSLLGRVRYMHQKLPDFVKREVEFTFLKATCKGSGSYLVGESANIDMGRGGTFAHAFCDEWSRVPQSEQCFSAVRSACQRGLVLLSTPWGPSGNFYRIKKARPETFKFIRLHWTKHPERAKDLTYDDLGRPTSSWYRRQISSMTQDVVARELDISYAKSVAGQVYPQFDYDIHVVPSRRARYQSSLPLYVGLDFGIAAATAGVIGQIVRNTLVVLGDYEVFNEVEEEHIKNLIARIKFIGYKGPLSKIVIWGDPAANARDMSGMTTVRSYKAAGLYVRTRKTRVLDGVRAVRNLLHQKRFFVNEDCVHLIERFGEHRFKTDSSDAVTEDNIEKNNAKHIMDGLRYLVVNTLPADGVSTLTDDTIPARAPGVAGPLQEFETRWSDLHDRGPWLSTGVREF